MKHGIFYNEEINPDLLLLLTQLLDQFEPFPMLVAIEYFITVSFWSFVGRLLFISNVMNGVITFDMSWANLCSW
jgi:hypothetical protein